MRRAASTQGEGGLSASRPGLRGQAIPPPAKRNEQPFRKVIGTYGNDAST